MGQSAKFNVVMPQLGESIVEATLLVWRVTPGETVQAGQILAEVETDKATNELPAPVAGLIAELKIAAGTTVPVKTVIAIIETLPTEHPSTAPRITTASRATPISPAVRKLVREHQLQISNIPGTGYRGRVSRDDVLRHLQQPATAPQQTGHTLTPQAYDAELSNFPSQLPTQVLQQASEAHSNAIGQTATHSLGGHLEVWTSKRKRIATRLRESLDTAVQVFAMAEIDMHSVLRHLEETRPRTETSGFKLTVLSYVVWALAKTLTHFPRLNAIGTNEGLLIRDERNMGVAVDTESGLLVPVVRRADELGILGIARAINALSSRARAGQLAADDMNGGTFTVSNPGRHGNLIGVSILRPPEVGILRLGQIRKMPVVVENRDGDVIAIRPRMLAALTYDHRFIDGREANAFLHALTRNLENFDSPNSGLN